MSFVNYHEYIQSEAWKARADAAKRRAGYRCQICNRHASQVTLNAHHRTYERLGHENSDDITVLCRDCHALYERHKKLPKPPQPTAITSPPPTLPDLAATSAGNGHAQASVPTPQSQPVDTDSTSETWNEEGLPTHLLVRMGQVVHALGYVGNGLYLLAIEWAMIIENPINLINPFLQFAAVIGWIFSPLFWQFVAITTMGILTTVGAVWLVQHVRPKSPMLKWYWRFRPSILLKAPLFLLCTTLVIETLFQLAITAFGLVVGYAHITNTIIAANVVHVYTSLVPLPILHLVWDNHWRHTWAKWLITIVIVPVLAILMILVDKVWGQEMCRQNLLDDWNCSIYTNSWWSGVDPVSLPTFSPTSTPMPTSIPRPLPTPTSTSTATRGAGRTTSALIFCTEADFDTTTQQCTRSQLLFTGMVPKIYISWTPSPALQGVTYLKKWYFNGEQFLDSESTNHYAWLEVDTRVSLKPGYYIVELYASGDLLQRNGFTIR